MDSNQPNPQAVSAPINIRSTALVILTAIALIVFLGWAQNVIAPILLGMLLSYALYPIVSFFNRFWVPHWLGAAIVVLTLIFATYYAADLLQDQLLVLLDKLPDAIRHFSRISSETAGDELSVLEKIRTAAEAVENVANSNGAERATALLPEAANVRVQEKAFDLREYLLGGSIGALVLIGQFVSVLLLVYFILASGRLYKEKLVKISGDTLSEKKITVTVLEEINRQLRLFFFVMLAGAIFVGVCTWLAFMWLGVEEAALWGTIAGIASMIPYLGPGIIFVATGFVAFVQFGTLGMALLVAGVSLVITSLQGNFLTPLMTSRASAVNAVGVFISLLFWGWLWGPVGLIVATPIQLIVKSICDHVENLQNVGELLGD